MLAGGKANTSFQMSMFSHTVGLALVATFICSRRCGILDIAYCVPNRLLGEVAAEKAARGQVEQGCSQLGLQLLELQQQLRASESREAAATSDLHDAMEQVSVQ